VGYRYEDFMLLWLKENKVSLKKKLMGGDIRLGGRRIVWNKYLFEGSLR